MRVIPYEEAFPVADYERNARSSRLPCQLCGQEAVAIARLSRDDIMVLCSGCLDATQFESGTVITPVTAGESRAVN